MKQPWDDDTPAIAEIVADLRKAHLLGLPVDADRLADQIEAAFARLEDWWHRAVGKGGIYYTPPEALKVVREQTAAASPKGEESLLDVSKKAGLPVVSIGE